MDEKIRSLWNNNKIFFFLLLPLILIVVFRDLIFAMIAGGARKKVEEARKQDEVLKDQITKNEIQAAKLKAEADALDNKIKERTEDEIDEDWHKK